MRAILAAAAMAVIGGAADAATFDYYGRSVWVEMYQDYDYLGGFLHPGLRVTFEVDEAITGPLIDRVVSLAYVRAGWYSSSYPDLLLEYLTFDANGKIIDWFMSVRDEEATGWDSGWYYDTYLAKSVSPETYWVGLSHGSGAWNDPSPVPLPASFGLLAGAIGAAGIAHRVKRRQSSS